MDICYYTVIVHQGILFNVKMCFSLANLRIFEHI